MDLKRWAHVVALADRRSFVRAAEQVHLSQPALTRSIQAAEAELGLVLFDRTSQEVTATRAGKFVIERARQLVFNSHCLARDVELYRNRGLGDIAFGVGPYPAATFLSPLLSRLRREHPQINLRVEIANWHQLVTRLLEEGIEFFVAETRDLPANPSLQIRKLRAQPGGFYVRRQHPLAGRDRITLAEVWAHGVACVHLPESVRALLARALGLASGSELPLALECDNVEVLKAVALDGDGVLAAPQEAVEKEVEAGSLTLLSITGLPPLASAMGVVALRGRTPSPMAELILGLLPTAD